MQLKRILFNVGKRHSHHMSMSKYRKKKQRDGNKNEIEVT